MISTLANSTSDHGTPELLKPTSLIPSLTLRNSTVRSRILHFAVCSRRRDRRMWRLSWMPLWLLSAIIATPSRIDAQGQPMPNGTPPVGNYLLVQPPSRPAIGNRPQANRGTNANAPAATTSGVPSAAKSQCSPDAAATRYGPTSPSAVPQHQSYAHHVLSRTRLHGVRFITKSCCQPDDANDIQTHASQDESSCSHLRFQSGRQGNLGLVLQTQVQVRPGAFIDTGYAGTGTTLNPGAIAINGSSAAHNRGQFIVFGQFGAANVPSRVQLGAQMPTNGAGTFQTSVDISLRR